MIKNTNDSPSLFSNLSDMLNQSHPLYQVTGGYKGKKDINGTKIMIPGVPGKSDSRYQKLRKHKLFCKRAGIEPTIGHLKSDYRLGRNFYKGVVGDTMNVLLAAAAYDFRRARKTLGDMLQKMYRTVSEQYLAKVGLLRDDHIAVFYYNEGF